MVCFEIMPVSGDCILIFSIQENPWSKSIPIESIGTYIGGLKVHGLNQRQQSEWVHR